MADYTIAQEDIGAYEIELQPGVPVSFNAGVRSANSIQIINHDSDSPVYCRLGDFVVVKDPRAVMAMPGTFVRIDVNKEDKTRNVVLVCASAAIVSVVTE